MKLNLGYPRLCLCLFYSVLLVSCTVKRTENVQAAPGGNNNPVYQLQVKLTVDNDTDELQGEFNTYLVQLHNTRYWHNNLLLGSQAIIFHFRFSDLVQQQQCRDQLSTTGQAEQINLTKI